MYRSLVNPPFSATSTVVAVKEQVSCDLNGETAILQLDRGMYYGLDPVGARVWTLIQEPRTVADLGRLLMQEYDVAEDRLQADLLALLQDLREHQLVTVVPASELD